VWRRATPESAAAGLAAYAQHALFWRGVERVGDVPWVYGWLHPMAGCLRAAIYTTALARRLRGAPRSWRGREVSGELGRL
jgi:hypothetical protein